MSEMVEVVIDSIRVSLMSQQRIVILRERDNERYLPIWVGIYEAESITMALQDVEVARPLTHDLLRNVFKQFDIRIQRVEVITLRDDTYFGNIVAEKDGSLTNIDCRPSDGLAIAVRMHVPIFVERGVMDAAGIIPEDDLQEEGSEPIQDHPETEIEEDSDDRLSVFQDFLENLDIDSSDDQEDGEELSQ
jgi:bifunctional DNase/RNase